MPLLSICIPTYNRANYLKKTIESIVCQQIFIESNEIEIVISDNCSQDTTVEVCKNFTQHYPDKIRYFKNDKNIVDKNLGLALKRGNGKFLKLHNDLFLFHDDSLLQILDLIKQNLNKKPNIFFVNGVLKTQEKVTKCTNFNDFVKTVSFYSTWSGGFGIWQEDLLKIKDFSEKSDLFLSQTHILFELVSYKKSLVFHPQYLSSQKPSLSGGYNLLQVFITNYLSLYQPYLNKKLLSKVVYENEGWKVLEEHVLPRYFNIGSKFIYKKNGFWYHTKPFHNSIFFYYLILKTLCKKMKNCMFKNSKGLHFKLGKIKIRLWSPKWIYIYSDKKVINIKIADKFKTRLWPLYKKGTKNYAKSSK